MSQKTELVAYPQCIGAFGAYIYIVTPRLAVVILCQSLSQEHIHHMVCDHYTGRVTLCLTIGRSWVVSHYSHFRSYDSHAQVRRYHIFF